MGLVIEFWSNSLAERSLRYSAWTVSASSSPLAPLVRPLRERRLSKAPTDLTVRISVIFSETYVHAINTNVRIALSDGANLVSSRLLAQRLNWPEICRRLKDVILETFA